MERKQEEFGLNYTKNLIVWGTDAELPPGTVLYYESGASDTPRPEGPGAKRPHRRGSMGGAPFPVSILSDAEALPRKYENPAASKTWEHE